MFAHMVNIPRADNMPVIDALSPWGIGDIPLPARPELISRALREADARRV